MENVTRRNKKCWITDQIDIIRIIEAWKLSNRDMAFTAEIWTAAGIQLAGEDKFAFEQSHAYGSFNDLYKNKFKYWLSMSECSFKEVVHHFNRATLAVRREMLHDLLI